MEDDLYVYVCNYQNEVRIHLREYFKNPEDDLVPTKHGATLTVEDFNILQRIGPSASLNYITHGEGNFLNHPLSNRSNYYLIVGKILFIIFIFYTM